MDVGLPRRRGGAWTWVIGIAAIFGAALAVMVLFPSRNGSCGSPVLKCSSNLRQIGQACLLYCNDHGGLYPTSLAAMQEEDIGAEVFLCPGMSSRVPTTYPANWTDLHSDYRYVGMGLNSTVPADVIVAYEDLRNHGESGANVLFGDGRVEWMRPDWLPKVFAESDRLRQEWEVKRRAEAKPPVGRP